MDPYYARLGFRFHPNDREIVKRYLEGKMCNGIDFPQITQVDIRNYEPWELPGLLSPGSPDDEEWYFFSPITYKDTRRSRIVRTTRAGNWRVTGSPREIRDENTNELIGDRKLSVFYRGHGSNAVKTDWVIHEFHSKMEDYYETPFVLCRLRKKSDDTQDEPSSHSASGSQNHVAENRM